MRGRGGEIVMDNFLLLLMIITLCLFGIQMSEMLKGLKYLQYLMELWGSEVHEHFNEKEK